MAEPGFSVVMPAYNAAATIERAVRSVTGQTDPDFELIVIDDGSRDATTTVVQQLADRDPRIRLIALAVNGGVAAARNVGIDAARGRYLAFLDADDYWLPDKLRMQRDAFGHGAAVVFAAYYRENGTGRKVVGVPERIAFKQLLRGNCIGNLTGAYDCRVLGKFHQQRIGHEDYLMWLETLRQGGAATGIQTPLAVYSDGTTSLSSNLLRSAMWTWRIYRQHLGLPMPTSLRCFLAYLHGAVSKRIGRRQSQ